MDQSYLLNGIGAEGTSHPCNICNKNYASFSSLMEHQRTHTGERPYGCTICNKRFTQKAHLIIHKRTHTGERPYACHICHKRFAQSSHLNSHKRIHTGEKPYFCSICNIGFCRKPRMEAHILQHVQEGRLGPEALTSLQTQGMAPRTDLGSSSMVFKVEPQDPPSMVSQQAFDLPLQGSAPDVFPPPFPTQVSSNQGLASGAVSTAANSSHRRKPSFVRRVNNGGEEEEESRGTGGEMDYSEEFGSQPLAVEGGESQVSQVELEDTTGGDGQSDEGDLKIDWPQVTFLKPERLDQDVEEEGEDPSGSGEKAGSRADLHREGTLTAGGSGDEGDNASVTSDSNLSSSDLAIPNVAIRRSLMTRRTAASANQASPRPGAMVTNGRSWKYSINPSPYVRTNNRISLVDFTAEDLLRHMMSRDDIHRCEFCCLIFQDPAMYHLHRSMHDKSDIRCCNLCGKLLLDKYDFTAHFLTEHKC